MKQGLTVIKNTQIVLENGILWDGVLLLDGDRIRDYGSAAEMQERIPENAEIIDANGAYVGPGFVDIHVHGGGGYTTYGNPVEAAEFFLRHGTTTILATPSYSLSFERFMDAIKTVKASMDKAKTVKGFYMEGPYMNPDYGANAWKNPWRDAMDPKQYKALVDEAGTLARVWAIAPERGYDLLTFLEYARKVNPDVVFALGHSRATPAMIRSLGKYRPMLQTHSMNATGRQPVSGGTRGYGPDEYCMKESDMYAELISDSCGIHVNPEIQQLVLHCKGIHRTILITDSCAGEVDPPPEHLKHVTDLTFDAHGGLSGSKMTMNIACRNIMTHTNCGIVQAFLMASANPARVLGMDREIGTIEPGKKADLVFVDDKFHVKQVMLGGELCQY